MGKKTESRGEKSAGLKPGLYNGPRPGNRSGWWGATNQAWGEFSFSVAPLVERGTRKPKKKR